MPAPVEEISVRLLNADPTNDPEGRRIVLQNAALIERLRDQLPNWISRRIVSHAGGPGLAHWPIAIIRIRDLAVEAQVAPGPRGALSMRETPPSTNTIACAWRVLFDSEKQLPQLALSLASCDHSGFRQPPAVADSIVDKIQLEISKQWQEVEILKGLREFELLDDKSLELRLEARVKNIKDRFRKDDNYRVPRFPSGIIPPPGQDETLFDIENSSVSTIAPEVRVLYHRLRTLVSPSIKTDSDSLPDLSEGASATWSGRLSLFRRPTPFYNGFSLYRIRRTWPVVNGIEPNKDGYVVASEFLNNEVTAEATALAWPFAILDGTSRPIHFFNSQARGDLQITRNTVVQYLKFFCEFVHGDAGAFYLLEAADDLKWRKDAAVGQAKRDLLLLKIQVPVHAPTWKGGAQDDIETFHCVATVNYGEGIFWAFFDVNSSGFVEMTDDFPLVEELPIEPHQWAKENRLFAALPSADMPSVELPSSDISSAITPSPASKSSTERPIVHPSGWVRPRPIELTGEDFAKWLSGVEVVVLADREIPDRVEIKGPLKITGHLSISRSRLEKFDFLDDVDLSNCKFVSKLEIIDCRFRGGLRLNEASVSGSLIFQEVTFESSSSRCSLDRARIGGALVFDGLSRTGDQRDLAITLTGAEISNHVSFKLEGSGFEPLEPIAYSSVGAFYIGAQQAIVGAEFKFVGPNIQTISSLDLSGIRLGGSLLLGGETGGLRVVNGINMNNAQIEGNVILKVVEVQWGGFNMMNIRVSGNVELRAGRVPGRPYKISGGFNAANANIVGNVLISGVDISGPLSFTKATIGGSFSLAAEENFRRAPILEGSLHCSDLRVLSWVWLRGVTIKGNVDFNGAALSGGLYLEPSGAHRVTIIGDLLLSRVRERPWFVAKGVSISGDLRILACDMRVVQIGPSSISEEGEFRILLPRVGRFLLGSTHVHGWCSVAFLQVDGTISSSGIQGLAIVDSTIQGELSVWSPTAFADLEQQQDMPVGSPRNPFEFSAAIIGPVSITNSSINGRLNLSFLKASGPLRLTSTQVKGDVLFCSTMSASALGASEESIVPPRRASVCGAELRHLRGDGDLDLTGLSVFQEDPPYAEQWPFGRPGAIDARYLKILGEVRTFTKLDNREESVDIPCDFDLRHAAAGSLEITEHGIGSLIINQAKDR